MMCSKVCQKKTLDPNLSLKRDFQYCFGYECSHPLASMLRGICYCTRPGWYHTNNAEWIRKSIELRYFDVDRGIAAFSKISAQKGAVLGEYFGEIVPADTRTDSPYLFQIKLDDEKGKVLAQIDGRRAGSWTRFVNHSCTPTCELAWVRVGRSAHVRLRTLTEVFPRTELTIDYGPEFGRS
jgi:SET domain-containing protein